MYNIIMKKISPTQAFIILSVVFTFLFMSHAAQAVTPEEAALIISKAHLTPEQATLINALTVTPFPPVQITTNPVKAEFKAGTTYQVDWTALPHFKNVGIIFRKGNGELVSLLSSLTTPINTAEKTQHFTLPIATSTAPGLYFVTIFPNPKTGDAWNTSLFNVVK